ncbi:MAG: DUF5995 family protein [Chitinophagales bacterium]
MLIKKNPYLLLLLLLFSCSKEDIIEYNQWTLSDESFSEILQLSDTTGLSDYETFGIRMDRIQSLFAEKQDPRGAFTTVYEQITNAAINSVNADFYENGQFVDDFGLAFGKLYLIDLHYHLLNQPLRAHWEAYYNECASSKHYTQLMAMGVNAHITIDLVDALIEVKVTEGEESDWVLISTALLDGIPFFQEEFESAYTEDISDLISLYGFGDFLDEINGENTTIYTLLNELRYVGYLDALKYQAGFEKNIEYKVRKRFEDLNNTIQFLDDLGLLP